jgi:hypothetical protein
VKIEHIFAADQHLHLPLSTDTEQKQEKHYTLKFIIVVGIRQYEGGIVNMNNGF